MNDTPAMALTTSLALSNQVKEFMIKQISSELAKIIGKKTKFPEQHKQKGKFQHQEWMFILPKKFSDIKTVNGRDYHGCLKFNEGKDNGS